MTFNFNDVNILTDDVRGRHVYDVIWLARDVSEQRVTRLAEYYLMSKIEFESSVVDLDRLGKSGSKWSSQQGVGWSGWVGGGGGGT